MKQCPRCETELNDNATACTCGWKDRAPKRATEPARVNCAYALCGQPAIVKLKNHPGETINVCDHHAHQLIQTRAEKTCATLGLTNLEQKRQWLRAYTKATVASQIEALREPGE